MSLTKDDWVEHEKYQKRNIILKITEHEGIFYVIGLDMSKDDSDKIMNNQKYETLDKAKNRFHELFLKLN